ncbi:MAG: VOC family protein [Gammaproteobacteria bacterium]|nr:VOC family protein [Gammaproteobacteria bacterium]
MNDAPRIRSIIKRTTLMVRNMEKSRRWYEHVLGMTTWLDQEFIISGEGIAVGSKGDKTHLVIMKAEDDKIGMIGLLQWLDPVLPAPEIPTAVNYGLPVFVVETDDAAELARRAEELGTRVYNKRHEFTVTGARGEKRHLAGASLFDPDGHFFECNQVLSVEEPRIS